jgi:DNA invertase Pin-like site-specific DNA recombinase
MLVGYARTSTTEQTAGFEAQIRDLKAAGCEEVFSEQVSSVAHRQKLIDAMHFVRKGDTLVVSKLDRLARSTSDLLSIVAKLEAKGCYLVVQSMSNGGPLDTSTATGKLMLTVLGAVAEFERKLMLERQLEGIAKAKAEKRYKGRQPTALAKKADVLRLTAEGVTRSATAKQLGIGIASVFRILAAEKAETKRAA